MGPSWCTGLPIESETDFYHAPLKFDGGTVESSLRVSSRSANLEVLALGFIPIGQCMLRGPGFTKYDCN